MNDEERYALLLLTAMKGIGSAHAHQLIEAFGSASNVLNATARSLQDMHNIGDLVLQQREQLELRKKVDDELRFIERHHIRVLSFHDDGYPSRLKECTDAPALLFESGNFMFNQQAVFVGVVGTRDSTEYGRDCTVRLIEELHDALSIPLVIVSGLAKGIDVTAHRAALSLGLPTLGVVAHGLNQIYPADHRETARTMATQGGAVLTEYQSHIHVERGNFLARNRIIAGLCDALLVTQSKDKGGALITAAIAHDYNREVFAVPGRLTDERSAGCNRLIRTNCASLVTSGKDIIEAMNWDQHLRPATPQQTLLTFDTPPLSPQEETIVNILKDKDSATLETLLALTGFDFNTLTEALFNLDAAQLTRRLPGSRFTLLHP